jgi:diadenosine tetraphosphate (Ap4A) HIT family hydrolase
MNNDCIFCKIVAGSIPSKKIYEDDDLLLAALEKIKEYSAEMRKKNETKPLQVTCMHCNHEYKQPLVLNFTDFFD